MPVIDGHVITQAQKNLLHVREVDGELGKVVETEQGRVFVGLGMFKEFENAGAPDISNATVQGLHGVISVLDHIKAGEFELKRGVADVWVLSMRGTSHGVTEAEIMDLKPFSPAVKALRNLWDSKEY